MTFKLHPDTTMGALSLNIRNMERSLAFYVGVLGFQVREQTADTAYLGAGGDDLLILNERPDISLCDTRSVAARTREITPSLT